MKKKLVATFAFLAAATAASAVPVDITTSVDEMIAQVTTTAGDVLPFVVALVGGGLVFKLIKRWVR